MSMQPSTTTTVNYQWTDYQAHVRDTLEEGDYDVVVLRIGYGGGKSRCGAQWVHRGAMTDQEGAGESLVMAQDFEKGKSTTYSVFFKTLPGDQTNPFKDGDPENSPIVSTYNANDKRVVYITGHVTWLGGADKWSRFAGGEFCRIWCDEVAHYPPQTDLYDLHRMLTTRQRTEVGPNTTLWTSTGNGYNPYYDITERQVQPDGDGGEQLLPWRDRLKVVVASTTDNALLPPDGLEKIVRQFKDTPREKQGLHGGFAAAEGLVYSNFSRGVHVISDDRADELAENADRIYGYDAGWDDPRVVNEWARTPHDQWVAVDEFQKSDTQPEAVIDPKSGTGWLAGKPRGPLYCEHEPAHIQKFRSAGWEAMKAEKSHDEGIPYVRGRLETDSEGEPGLFVAERCVNLIKEFQSYQEEHVGKDGADDHQLDAARYALFTHSLSDDSGFSRSNHSLGSIT